MLPHRSVDRVPAFRSLPVELGSGDPAPVGVLRTRPPVLVVEGLCQGVVGSPPAGARDVQGLPRLQVGAGCEDVDVSAPTLLPVEDGGPGVRKPPPLFEADPEIRGRAMRCEKWAQLFATIRAQRPVLVVIDPILRALAGVSPNEPGPVAAFLDALQAEAEAGNFGILLVAHDTKAARSEARAGGDPGAGVIAGSGAWHDLVRSVLYMRRDPVGGNDRILEVVKANYGPTGWGARLEEALLANGGFGGLRLTDRLNREGVRAATQPPRRGKTTGKPNGRDAEKKPVVPIDPNQLPDDEVPF